MEGREPERGWDGKVQTSIASIVLTMQKMPRPVGKLQLRLVKGPVLLKKIATSSSVVAAMTLLALAGLAIAFHCNLREALPCPIVREGLAISSSA